MFSRLRILIRFAAAVAFVATALSAAVNADQAPRLTIVLVVDQMLPEYFTRFDTLYSGGLARLYRNGAVFLNTRHEHSETETGVGHATIATGCHPAQHGVIANDWWDPELRRVFYCVEDTTVTVIGNAAKKGVSPISLRRGTIVDWLRRGNPECKAFAVAAKDRAAICMAGFSSNAAYWYDYRTGLHETSLFYTSTYPDWVADLRAARPADDYFVGIWDRLLTKDAYLLSGPDSVTAEADGKTIVFPHEYSVGPNEPPEKYYANLLYTPFGDHLTLRFATAAVEAESLGRDNSSDLLMIGLSSTDYVGHRYGPKSHEVQDHYLRLDRYLGDFFAMLDSTVGAANYVVALTSDHGVCPLPELLRAEGQDAGRIHPDTLRKAVSRACASTAQKLGLKDLLLTRFYRGLFLNYSEAAQKGIGREQLQDAVAEALKQVSFISDAYTEREMIATGGSPRPFLQRYRNNYFAGRSAEIEIRLKENYIVDDEAFGATHGSCYNYDCVVPLIFYGPMIRAEHHADSVETVDLAPTLAEILGLVAPDGLDGRSLLLLISK